MVYISGPISNDQDYMKKFTKTAIDLVYGKYVESHSDIINPARVLNTLPVQKLQYDDLMKLCLDLLSMCDTICMMKGWQESKGACIEYQYAVDHNLTVIEQY